MTAPGAMCTYCGDYSVTVFNRSCVSCDAWLLIREHNNRQSLTNESRAITWLFELQLNVLRLSRYWSGHELIRKFEDLAQQVVAIGIEAKHADIQNPEFYEGLNKVLEDISNRIES